MDTITTIQSLLKSNGSAQPVMVALTPNELRLIAAAPDMLAALKSVVAAHDDWQRALEPMKDRGYEFDDPLSDAIKSARAAIAKATGEKS